MQNENISHDIKRMCKTPAEKKCARRGDQNSCLLMQNLLACMHNDYNHFFRPPCCFVVSVSQLSECLNEHVFQLSAHFLCDTHEKKRAPYFDLFVPFARWFQSTHAFFLSKRQHNLSSASDDFFSAIWFDDTKCRWKLKGRHILNGVDHSIAVIGLLTRSIK